MKWKTSISTHKDNETYIRGQALSKLMQDATFPEVAFLLLGERVPTKAEAQMFDMILVSCVEHGVETPSAFTARVSASVGNPLHVALAAGLLATGPWHGGAIEESARYMQLDETPAEIVSRLVAEKKRLPGFGHKIYKDKDPRAEAMLSKAIELGIAGKFVNRARELESELDKQTGKHLPINIDGAIAAIISEFGFDWRLGNALFTLGRMPGLIAHAFEEIKNEKPYRRFDDTDVEYTGPAV